MKDSGPAVEGVACWDWCSGNRYYMYLIPAEAGCWTYRGRCISCRKTYETQPFSEQGWTRYKRDGALIQDVLPGLSTNDREFIISGTCPTCFNNLCKEEDAMDEELAHAHEDDEKAFKSVDPPEDGPQDEDLPF